MSGTGRMLWWSLLATLAFVGVEVFAGIRAHSLALVSDAGHNFTDALALLLAWFGFYLQSRPADEVKTYGYHRAGVLAAFINALTLVAISFYILYEAVLRLTHPVEVQARIMIWVAAAGLVMNGTISWFLFREAHDVNIRSAFIHQLGDTLSTAAVIAGGWSILLTGRHWIDPALSIGIGCLILWSSLGIIRETLNILLEGAPAGISVQQIVLNMSAIQGVEDVHDVHVWSIGSDNHALSCHVRIADMPLSESEEILRRVTELLAGFHIHHTTIQFENALCTIHPGCVVPVGTVGRTDRFSDQS
jgi:cobalt-zinc-cadmium efflux system protein